jgi:hypothetical protein
MNHSSMTDDELVTAVRESVTGVHMTISAEQIATRGRTIRTRRRVPLLTGVLAGTAGAALAVTTMLSPGHQAGQPVAAKLTAWTVTKQADGDIRVIVRELSDAAGLERTLRADGLPVAVRFRTDPLPLKSLRPGYQIIPGCQSLSPGLSQLDSVFKFYPGLDDSVPNWSLGDTSEALLIHPSALPDGAGVAIVAFPKDKVNFIPMVTDLVQKSQECTG